jgi:hypothetical protein
LSKLGVKRGFPKEAYFEHTMSKACHNGTTNHPSLIKRKIEGHKFT